jgi:hypothetical protein
MIVFDLKCGNGHVFEAWFGSSADYESQRARHLLSCPMCGNSDVGKALMAPNVAPKGNQRRAPAEPVSVPVAAGGEHSPEAVKQALALLAEMQARVEASFDDVGDKFAEEARRIHYGEAEARGILGEATLEQAKELHEEGIDVLPLPFRRRRKRLDA